MAACGYYHTVTLTEEGDVWTCGAGTHGQLGHDNRDHLLKPQRVGGEEVFGARVIEVTAGPRHTMAVCQDGTVWSWGGSSEGQLGHGEMGERVITQKPARLEPSVFAHTPVLSGLLRNYKTCTCSRVWSHGALKSCGS